MPAATSDLVRNAWALPELAPNECRTILQNTTIFAGSLAMLVGGKAQPYASGTAGASMLGLALKQYAAPAGSDLLLSEEQRAIFRRGVFGFPGKAGDLPDETLINKPVFFDDSIGTVKATAAANDLSGTLRAIADGAYWVEVQ
jgi:hypothetical protein